MKIAFLGDIALIGKYDSSIHDFEEIKKRFESLKKILDECDYVIANLESPFTIVKKTNEAKTLPLRTDIENVKILKYLGIDAVSIANNHFFDYGDIGAKECIECLEKANISWFGINEKSYMIKKDDIKVIVGGYCCHTTNAWHFDDNTYKGNTLNTLSFHKIETFINESKKHNAFPIVFTHWGEENTHYPRKEHLEIAEYILKKYKTMIVGHHPHVLQGIKSLENGKVFFSLGNFCFDDCISTTKSNVSVKQTEDNLKAGIVIFEFDKNGIISDDFVTFRDTGKEILIDNSILKEVDNYSAELYKEQDWIIYEARRKYEQKNAFNLRLGKRNVKWLVGHMNITSIKTVLQRRRNNELFLKIIDDFHEHYRISGKKYNFIDDKVILYVGNFDRPDKSAAGKRVFGNAKILEELGYTVILIGKEKEYDDTVKYSENIYFYSFPNFSMYKYKTYVRWIKDFMESLNIKPKMIFRYGSPSLALFDKELSSFGSKTNIPIITDVVDWLAADGGNIIFNTIKTIDTLAEKAFFNKQCDGAIVISSYLKEYYKKYKSKCIVVPPLVPEYKENRSKNQQIKIVYAGSPFRKGIEVKNVHKLKDRLDLCVKYISELPEEININFDIFGLTEAEFRKAFPNMNDVISFKRISFNGIKPMKEVQQRISSSDFTILLREKTKATTAGFPTKVVESISLGTPVITTKTSDLQDYISDGNNGYFVDIDNPILLLEKMINIFSMSIDDISEMKRNCFSDSAFIYNNYLSDMENLIKQVLK